MQLLDLGGEVLAVQFGDSGGVLTRRIASMRSRGSCIGGTVGGDRRRPESLARRPAGTIAPMSRFTNRIAFLTGAASASVERQPSVSLPRAPPCSRSTSTPMASPRPPTSPTTSKGRSQLAARCHRRRRHRRCGDRMRRCPRRHRHRRQHRRYRRHHHIAEVVRPTGT